MRADDPGLAFHIVDVFTATPFSGNPLAVVLGAEELSTQQMQRLASHFNLSETAFPIFGEPQVEQVGADYRLRIFTTETEVPFAGHPSIGSAWLLRELGLVVPRDGHVVQLCGAGPLPIRFDADTLTLNGGTPSWGRPVEAAPLLAAAGLRAADGIGPALVCSTGLPFAVVRVSGEALTRCSPDLSLLRGEHLRDLGTDGVYVVAWDDLADPVRARMFAGDVTEDAATGSAALACGVYLTVTGVLPEGGTVAFVQGVEMGRPSQLTVTIEAAEGVPTRLQVTGGAVAVSSGRTAIPAA